jgi:putative PIN family toxin of toxin-antitoxin system
MKHHRIVLDTNVLISAILFGGPPREALKLVISGTVDCSLSLAILDELRDVLQRPKFKFSPEQSFNVLEELHAACDIINPMVKINVITEDPDDNKILECAVAAKSTFIVSGDRHLLDLVEFRGIKILTPTAYLKMVKDSE